ncbi:hypothetical protein HY214_03675 [Candidatus Roizmanbacteria bacterium]|nr:hypothetical protein [Candidatus Roizmanbacteria bacterium]
MLTYLFTQTPLSYLLDSFWRDEAFSYFLAKRSLIDILMLTARDFSPPFYYLFLHFWIMIAGKGEIALRLPSLFFYLATLCVVFLFMTRVIKLTRINAYLYLTLFILNPLLLPYAFEARMYTMFAYFASLSFYALMKQKRKTWIVATLLGLFTHYFMILIVVGQITYLILTVKGKKIIPYFATFVRPFFLFVPWMIYVFMQRKSIGEQFWIPLVTRKDFYYLLGVLFSGYETGFGILKLTPSGYITPLLNLSVILLTILAGGFLLIHYNRKKEKLTLVILAAWSLLPVLIVFGLSVFQPLYLPRYLIFATVGFLLLLVTILQEYPPLARLFLFIVLLRLSLDFNTYRLAYHAKPNYRGVIKEIKRLAGPDDFLYVSSELDYHVAQYYFDEKRVFIYDKTYEEIPRYVGKVLIPPSAVVKTLPVYPQKAFVLGWGLSYEIKALY